MVIVGHGALPRRMAQRCWRWPRKSFAASSALARGWNGFTVLHTAASRVGGLDLGFVPGPGGRDVGMLAGCAKGEIAVVYLLGADEIDCRGWAKAFVVYQGTTAMPAPSAPTSSCRAPPTPKSPAPTSTPRAACRARRAPLRRAMPARTGRSCARLSELGQDPALRHPRRCAAPVGAASLPRSTSGPGDIWGSAHAGRKPLGEPFGAWRSRLLPDQSDRARLGTMAECTRLVSSCGGGVGTMDRSLWTSSRRSLAMVILAQCLLLGRRCS